MILYHGTNMDFETIDLSKCLPHKDFGKGFYLTSIRKDALGRAKDKCRKEGGGVPTVLSFQWDENVTGLNVKRFEKMDEEWADFIVSNRSRQRKQKHSFDIVIGPVADDGVILSIQLFEAQVINMATLLERLNFVRPTIQYCFCTQKAIGTLKRL